MAICDGPAIERRHLPQGLDEQQKGSSNALFSDSEDSKTLKSLEEHERDYIIHILKSVEGNKTKAAKLMGIDRVSLWRKLNKYKESGIDIDRLFTQ